MPRKRVSKVKQKAKGDEPEEKKVKREHVTVQDEGEAKPETKSPGWIPENWPQTYENIKMMMEGVVAPLESMPWYIENDPSNTKPEERFRILVALMLSSQTKDEQTLKVWNELCADGLSIEWVLAKSDAELSKCIPVNFRNTKSSNIRKVATILKENYNGDTPDNAKDLIDLPGVGPKMAYLFLQSCYKKSDGLGVDVHMHRLANRLGWVQKSTKDAEKTRVALESWLSKDLIYEFNRLIPRFGQMKCTADKPKCKECLNNLICPSAGK